MILIGEISEDRVHGVYTYGEENMQHFTLEKLNVNLETLQLHNPNSLQPGVYCGHAKMYWDSSKYGNFFNLIFSYQINEEISCPRNESPDSSYMSLCSPRSVHSALLLSYI